MRSQSIALFPLTQFIVWLFIAWRSLNVCELKGFLDSDMIYASSLATYFKSQLNLFDLK